MLKKISSITLLSVVLVVSCLAVVAVIAGPDDLAQRARGLAQGIPFTFDPGKVSYEISQPDYGWIDVSATRDEQITDAESVDNVGSTEIDIGFYFPFFEGIYRWVRLSDNGYLYFGGDEEDGGNAPQTVPSSVDLIHNLIAPLGADLFRYEDSAVYIARQTEPERRLVLQFEKAYWCCSLGAPNDFQVILYPDGRILTQYQSIHSENASHAYLTVGIENQDGTRGHNFYTGFLDRAPLQDQQAVLYDPGNTMFGRVLFIPDAETAQVASGQTQTVTLGTDLLNLSGADSNFTITHTLQVNGVGVSTTSDEPEEPAWSYAVTEPGFVKNTDFVPLTVEVIVPETAVVGDTAVITLQALTEAVEGPALDAAEGPVLSAAEGSTATATFTVVVAE